MALPSPHLATALLLLLATPASAKMVCTHGSARRTVAVESRAESAPVPCSVRYTKEPEGIDTILWRAEVDRAFCEDKAADLAARLRVSGWRCLEAPAPGVATERPTPAPASARAEPRPPPAPPVSAGPTQPMPVFPSTASDRADASHLANPGAPPKTPVASIEAPPPALSPPARTLREGVARDPRMRFYSQSVGEATLREALRLVPVDLNGDGRDELFVQVDLPALCGEAPCTWDLFEVGADGSLASLGVQQIVDWRVLGDRSQGFPDLAVRTLHSGDAEYGVYRFELGLYRRVDERVSSELFASGDERLPAVSAP